MSKPEPIRLEIAERKLEQIRQWCDAYPLDIFPEPDLGLAATALAREGITLAAVSASMARKILAGVREIVAGET